MRRRLFLQATAAAGASALAGVSRIAQAQTGLAAGMQAVVTTDTVNLRGGPGANFLHAAKEVTRAVMAPRD